MDDTRLHALFDAATAPEPPTDRPIGRIIADSRRVGVRLRRRRLTGSATAAVVAVAVIATAVSFVSAASGNPSPASHFTRSGQMGYVLTYSGDVVPVNLTTLTAGPPLQTGLNPLWKKGQGIQGPDIVAARGGRTLYVSTVAHPKIGRCTLGTCSERGRGAILPVSTATGKIGRRIAVAGLPCCADPLVGAPNGEIAYAMDIGFGYAKPSAALAQINLTTGTELHQMSMPFPSMQQAVASLNSRTLFVAGAGPGGAKSVPGAETVASVNVASGRAHKAISLAYSDLNQTCIAVSPNGATGYITVASMKNAVMVPIDVSANRPLRAIKLPNVRHSSSARSCSMAVTPDGRTAYVLFESALPVGVEYHHIPHTKGRTVSERYVIDRYVMPIDLVTGRALRPIKLPGGGSYGGNPEFAIDPDGRFGYALTESGVTPIDLATNTALPTIRLGKEADHTFLSFSPNGKTVLVGLEGPNYSGTVLPIQAATGKAGKPIRMPGAPAAIAVTP
jgi:hypothetical protein